MYPNWYKDCRLRSLLRVISQMAQSELMSNKKDVAQQSVLLCNVHDSFLLLKCWQRVL